jgi:hypothetical protein
VYSRTIKPSQAYVPGKTPRHEEGAFDTLRATARAGMSVEALTDSAAFQTGLDYLATGLYWEAHEVLETVWLVLPDESDARWIVQSLIQLANARLKHAMDRPKAALRLCAIVQDLLSKMSTTVVMGLKITKIREEVVALEKQIKYAL